jgi:uncharacterized damage-inducible protein DinB
MENKNITIKMVLSAWNNGQEKINKLLGSSDEELLMPVAEGRNKVSWIIGHMAAVNDSMFTILGLGNKVNTELYDHFSNQSKDNKAPDLVTIRNYWKDTSSELTKKINSIKEEEWFERHMSVSPEDFIKEPHRNKLNVVFTRIMHVQHHYGQIALTLTTNK